MKKKFKPAKRDWVKYPDLYDYLTNPVRVMRDMRDVNWLIEGFGKLDKLSDLEKLCKLSEISRNYNKEYFDRLFVENKILTGKVKPRNASERKLLKEHIKQQKQRKEELKEQMREQKRLARFR